MATRTVDLPGVTTYATTIETDYILADNNNEISPILAVFETMTLGGDGHPPLHRRAPARH